MQQFSGEHIAALVVTAAIAGVSVWAPRRHPGAWVPLVSRGLAVLILGAYLTEHLVNGVQGNWSPDYNLPLQLTDAVTLVAVAALWTPRLGLVELTYFWALAASLQAVLTPDLGQRYPSVFYFTYFTTHSGAVVAACFLVFGRRLYPRPGAVWRVYALTVGFAAIAAAGDLVTGGNYMYLDHKPAHGSLLNVMGPWPWYILSGAALGLAMFLALAAIAELLRRRDAARFLRSADPAHASRRSVSRRASSPV
jgi:hypothetical integral membrane protein (TIGR02206 family)